MTICSDCANNKGLIAKDKEVGVWMGKCPYCGLNAFLCDEGHDYRIPGQRPATLHDVLLYQANNPEEL